MRLIKKIFFINIMMKYKMDVRMFLNSNVRNAYIWVLAVMLEN